VNPLEEFDPGLRLSQVRQALERAQSQTDIMQIRQIVTRELVRDVAISNIQDEIERRNAYALDIEASKQRRFIAGETANWCEPHWFTWTPPIDPSKAYERFATLEEALAAGDRNGIRPAEGVRVISQRYYLKETP
jgi:hypothetical protein